MRIAAGVGVAAAVLIAATAPLWSAHVFVDERLLSVALLCVGLAGFCLHATLLGALAGVDRWSEYGALMVTDAVLRVAVAAVTFAVGLGLWRLPVGDRRRRVRVAADAARLTGHARGGTVAHPGHRDDVPARCRRTRSPRPVPARSW